MVVWWGMLPWLAGCATGEDEGDLQRSFAQQQAQAREAVALAPEHMCEPRAAGCEPLGVDPATCVDAAGLVQPVLSGSVVVAATVVPEVVATLGLPDGAWHARYPDPTGGCDDLVVAFHSADGGLTVTAPRTNAEEAIAGDERVQRSWGDTPAWLAAQGGEP